MGRMVTQRTTIAKIWAGGVVRKPACLIWGIQADACPVLYCDRRGAVIVQTSSKLPVADLAVLRVRNCRCFFFRSVRRWDQEIVAAPPTFAVYLGDDNKG